MCDKRYLPGLDPRISSWLKMRQEVNKLKENNNNNVVEKPSEIPYKYRNFWLNLLYTSKPEDIDKYLTINNNDDLLNLKFSTNKYKNVLNFNDFKLLYNKIITSYNENEYNLLHKFHTVVPSNATIPPASIHLIPQLSSSSSSNISPTLSPIHSPYTSLSHFFIASPVSNSNNPTTSTISNSFFVSTPKSLSSSSSLSSISTPNFTPNYESLSNDIDLLYLTAITHRNLEFLEYLVMNSFNLTYKVGKKKRTILHIAIIHNDYTKINYLIKNTSKNLINIIDNQDKFPLLYAVLYNKNYNFNDQLIYSSKQFYSNNNNSNDYYQHHHHHDNDKLNLLNFSNNFSINSLNYLENNIKIIILLIDNGANINNVDQLGNTCLHYACLMNLLDLVELLITKGSDISIKNNENKVPYELTKDIRIKRYIERCASIRGKKVQYLKMQAFITSKKFVSEVMSSVQPRCEICKRLLSTCSNMRKNDYK